MVSLSAPDRESLLAEPHVGASSESAGQGRSPFVVRRRLQVAIDCSDPERLATFWATLLGYVVDVPPAGHANWQDFSLSAGVPGESWSAVVDPAGVGPRVLFHRVPESKVGKNRVHLDVRLSADSAVSPETRRRQVDAEVARLQTLGGNHLRTEEDEHDYFAVMTDPEGNEFCIN
ncbi:MAG: VOC family protein [Nocardiopsaceae bacterium]|jgi:hypothetical protein|nr:VOC family protein [Nocardiopsaceae bacterium]